MCVAQKRLCLSSLFNAFEISVYVCWSFFGRMKNKVRIIMKYIYSCHSSLSDFLSLVDGDVSKAYLWPVWVHRALTRALLGKNGAHAGFRLLLKSETSLIKEILRKKVKEFQPVDWEALLQNVNVCRVKKRLQNAYVILLTIFWPNILRRKGWKYRKIRRISPSMYKPLQI